MESRHPGQGRHPSAPWYREPWPWLLMLGPAIVVVAGINLMVVAFAGADALVADDYYKQGLGINRSLARDARARELRLAARVQVDAAHDRVRVTLDGAAEASPSLKLLLRHPTRAAEDRAIALARVSPGLYEGRIEPFAAAAWHVQLEDGAARWRLAGRWSGAGEFTLESARQEAAWRND
jgi:uncharacterized protein